MDEHLLHAQDLWKTYGERQVLKGVDMAVKKGEIVAIIGASGAGKSTLLHLLGTLDKPDKGDVTLEGTQLSTLPNKEIGAFRNQKIGFVFQFHHLLPEFSALENICLPGYIAKEDIKTLHARGQNLLVRLGLEGCAERKPHSLSGGEQQRVAVARALINRPSIVFADEPSGNLDALQARSLYALFVELQKEMAQTFVIVTHNMELASSAHRICEVKDGTLR